MTCQTVSRIFQVTQVKILTDRAFSQQQIGYPIITAHDRLSFVAAMIDREGYST